MSLIADCCSSRIFLLKEQTFNIIQQHKLQQYQQNDDHHQPANEKFEQHVYNGSTGSSDKVFNRNRTDSNVDDESSSGDEQSNVDGSSSENSAHLDRPPPANGASYTTNVPHNPSDHITDPIVREQLGENKGYQLFDIYYSIMNDVLSFPCTGEFLTKFCLNGGRCFRYPVGNHSLFSCECADGYVGERCESKNGKSIEYLLHICIIY